MSESNEKIHQYALKALESVLTYDPKYEEKTDWSYINELCDLFDDSESKSRAILNKHPRILEDPGLLKEVLPELLEVDQVGTLLNRKWFDYFLEEENNDPYISLSDQHWLSTILSWLAYISAGAYRNIFRGIVSKAKITSATEDAEDLKPGADYMQVLVVDLNGDVKLEHYGIDGEKSVRTGEVEDLSVASVTAKRILDMLVTSLNKRVLASENDDNDGRWTLTLSNLDGKDFTYMGSQDDSIIRDLNNYIRKSLKRDDLHVFSSYSNKDHIDSFRLQVDKFTNAEHFLPENIDNPYLPLTSEILSVNRKHESAWYRQRLDNGAIVTKELKSGEKIAEFLDSIDPEVFQAVDSQKPDHNEIMGPYVWEFDLSFDLSNTKPTKRSGYYDAAALPLGWLEVMEKAKELFNFEASETIFDARVFESERGYKGNHILLKVELPNAEESFSFLTHNNEILVGDEVFIPAKDDKMLVRAKVVKKSYLTDDELANSPETYKYLMEPQPFFQGE